MEAYAMSTELLTAADRDYYYRQLLLVNAHLPKLGNRGAGPRPTYESNPLPFWTDFHGMQVGAAVLPTTNLEFSPSGWIYKFVAQDSGKPITDMDVYHLLTAFADDPDSIGRCAIPKSRRGEILFEMPAKIHHVTDEQVRGMHYHEQPFIHAEWLRRRIPSLSESLRREAREDGRNLTISLKDGMDPEKGHALMLGAILESFEACGQNVIYVPDGLRKALERTEAPVFPKSTRALWDCFFISLESPREDGIAGIYFLFDNRDLPDWVPEQMKGGGCITILGVYEPPDTRTVVLHGWDHEAKRWKHSAAQLLTNVLAYVAYSSEERRVDDSGPRERASLERQLKRVKGGQKRAKLQRRLERTSGATVVYLGGADLDDARPGPSEAAGPRREHWVRGHWRNQACGEGQKQRRLKWIRPHRRCLGAEVGAIIQKTYKLPDTVA
jgi:hypothetical protein